MDSEHAKKLLTDRLAELDERERRSRSSEDEQVPEQGTLGQHPADYGSDLTNQMEREQKVQRISWERQQILGALQLIEAGTYGRCRIDGEPIDDARLEARPEAELCLRHQVEAERRSV
jgi:RNA polymerase-binding transcription factor DksA